MHIPRNSKLRNSLDSVLPVRREEPFLLHVLISFFKDSAYDGVEKFGGVCSCLCAHLNEGDAPFVGELLTITGGHLSVREVRLVTHNEHTRLHAPFDPRDLVP